MGYRSTIGAVAASVAVFLAVQGCNAPKPKAAAARPIDGLVLIGDKEHVANVLKLSADGRAAVGLIGDSSTNGEDSFRWTKEGGLQIIRTKLGGEVRGTAISAEGSTVVGSFKDAAGLSHVFRWTEGGGVEDLGAPEREPAWGCPACGATAVAVSSNGAIVFGHFRKIGSFRWTRATGIRDLHIPADIVSASADGLTAFGERYIDLPGDRIATHLFRWTTAHGFEDLGVPADAVTGDLDTLEVGTTTADGKTVFGMYPAAEGMRAFRWTQAGGFQRLPNGERPSAVSGDGSQMFGVLEHDRRAYCTRWSSDGSSHPVGLPGFHMLVVNGVSYDGLTIAGHLIADPRAFVLRLRAGS